MERHKLSIQTFFDLVQERACENSRIEFKKYTFEDGKVTNDQKEKLEKEIVAFANADGGVIFIGIDESKDKVASQVVGVGCGIDKFDDIQLAIQGRLFAKVHPRIYGISMKPFMLPDNDNDMVIAISVPKSISRPHAVNDGNKDNFYIRHSNGIAHMNIDDLRREILSGATYQREITRYRQDRVSMIMSNEYIRNLQEGAKLVVHIIPFWSLDFGNFVNLSALDSWSGENPFVPFSSSGTYRAYCSDGRIAYSSQTNLNSTKSSVLVTRTGIVEAIDVSCMNYRPENKVAHQWYEVERRLYKKLNDYAELLERLDVPKPWFISMCITNGKGYWTECYGEESQRLYSDYIQGVDVIWNEGQSINEVISPCFDSLCNAFGFEKSFIEFGSM